MDPFEVFAYWDSNENQPQLTLTLKFAWISAYLISYFVYTLQMHHILSQPGVVLIMQFASISEVLFSQSTKAAYLRYGEITVLSLINFILLITVKTFHKSNKV